jgi:hypothetical protein
MSSRNAPTVWYAGALALFSLPSVSRTALAQDSEFAARPPLRESAPSTEAAPLEPGQADVKRETVKLAFTESAFGVREKRFGAMATAGAFATSPRHTEALGGGMLYGSPLERLLLVLTTERTFDGRWAPAGTVAFRFVGSNIQGYALSGLARYRTEGFSELGGEVEGGILFSLAQRGLHLDANLVFGGGVEEEEAGEADGELKLRAGYDVARWLRVGLDGQARKRLAGDALAPGGRTWDVVGGPQLLVSWQRFYASATFGPSTVGVAHDVRWAGLLAIGGVTP